MFCYACDEGRLDDKLVQHLGAFGIDVAQQTKTEMTIDELELKRSLEMDWNKVCTGLHHTPLRVLYPPPVMTLRVGFRADEPILNHK